ncbi:hypothetical protein MKZ20_08100 [Psychrobacillus sp. FSL K6-2684]|uniref:hypothetical protein n=1 Tax=Psychrobacillus sp. FSL K6-2684 TaxID=2921547 RepID=UPI0030F54E4A
MKIKNWIKKRLIGFDLSEPHNLLTFIGVSFIVLGIIYFFGIVKLSQMTVIGITLSGIFFVLGDICQHFIDSYELKKALDLKHRMLIQDRWKLCKLLCLLIAILSLIIAPYIQLNVSQKALGIFGTSLTLIAIGFTIINVSLYNHRKLNSFHAQLADEFYKSMMQEHELNELKKGEN